MHAPMNELLIQYYKFKRPLALVHKKAKLQLFFDIHLKIKKKNERVRTSLKSPTKIDPTKDPNHKRTKAHDQPKAYF